MNKDFLMASQASGDKNESATASPMSRRSFIKGGTVLGVSSLLAGSSFGLLPELVFAESIVDIAAVTGADYYQGTIRSVEILGGMGRFVPKQSRVGLLINSPWRHPGSYVTPEITLAAVWMCLDAGAAEIGVFQSIGRDYWGRSPLSDRFQTEIDTVRYIGGNYTEISIPRGLSLKKAEIARGLLDCDVFINISIAKHHAGTHFTGVMKNMMGATSRSTNRFFHHGSGKGSGSYGDVAFLSQCIADVNLVRKPDLCILDGTEVLLTNGPGGPGKLLKPQKVFAGVDRVAMDAYGAALIGLHPADVQMIQMAHVHGLGEIRLDQLRIREVTA